ncbi:MAG: hypothetical protein IJD70_00705 [Clostridia bacterium]|nr:hypothetical protein [Clostridia bacterium]
MSGKYRLLCVILACVFVILKLPSCVGIGDGALTGENNSTDPGFIGVIPPETDVSVSSKDNSCVINIFNSEGHSSYIAHPNAELQSKLRGLLENGTYASGSDSSGPGDSYIRVLFTDDGDKKEAYLVYSNNEVKYSNSISDSLTSLGTLNGIYQDVRAFGDEANKAKSEASKRAGYSVSNLIVTVKSGYNPNLTDFSELDCIGIFHMMDLNTGETMYTFHFDSDNKERIDEIAEKLSAYEGVVSVSCNYIVNFD